MEYQENGSPHRGACPSVGDKAQTPKEFPDLRLHKQPSIDKKFFHLIGIGLTLVSIVFLGIALFRQFDAIRDMQWEAADFLAVVAATVLFLISYLLMAMSWALMLEDETRHWQELTWAV